MTGKWSIWGNSNNRRTVIHPDAHLRFFRLCWNDSWASTCYLQLARRTSCKTEFAPRGIVRVLEIQEKIIVWFSISGKWLPILKMCKPTWVSSNKDLDGEKNRLWRIVGKIWFWPLNWVLELLILNLRIPHCLTFSYRWHPKFNTSFCYYYVSESGIFGVPLQNQLQDDKVRNEKASIPPFYTEVRTTTWAEA